MLIAAADGVVEKAERDKIDRLITTNPQLAAFSAAGIRKIIKGYEDQLDADFDTGKRRLLQDVEKVADNDNDAEEVFLNVLAVAKSDGEVEPDELKVIQELATILGQDLKQFGLS